jgi:hypothetical protein
LPEGGNPFFNFFLLTLGSPLGFPAGTYSITPVRIWATGFLKKVFAPIISILITIGALKKIPPSLDLLSL